MRADRLEAIGQRLSQQLARRPDFGDVGKIPHHRLQPLLHVLRDAIEQERHRPATPRAVHAARAAARGRTGWARRSGSKPCRLVRWPAPSHGNPALEHARRAALASPHGRRGITTTLHLQPSARRAERLPRRVRASAAAGARHRAADAVRFLPRAGRWRRRLRGVLGETVVHRTAVLPAARHSLCLRSRSRNCCRWRRSPIRRPTSAPAPRCAMTTSPARWFMR